MVEENLLQGKRILIVDDDPDILETLEDLLSTCEVEKAIHFDEAKSKLETRPFDMAILDIMGVGGYDLLKIANSKGVIAIMLTAHALSPEDTVRSFKEGAASYVPKEQIAYIATFLTDILEARATGKNVLRRWIQRLGTYYEGKFGPDWKKSDVAFWEKFLH